MKDVLAAIVVTPEGGREISAFPGFIADNPEAMAGHKLLDLLQPGQDWGRIIITAETWRITIPSGLCQSRMIPARIPSIMSLAFKNLTGHQASLLPASTVIWCGMTPLYQVEPITSPPRVITAYRTSKVSKYWRNEA